MYQSRFIELSTELKAPVYLLDVSPLIGIFSRLLHFTHFFLKFLQFTFQLYVITVSTQIGKLLCVFAVHHGLTEQHLLSLVAYRLQSLFLEYLNCFHIKIFPLKILSRIKQPAGVLLVLYLFYLC